jgi:DNA-binding protein Fis
MKVLAEKGRYNLETYIACLDGLNAFDRVQGDNLFELLQITYIPNLLLRCVIEICSGNKSKYTQQINRRTYN